MDQWWCVKVTDLNYVDRIESIVRSPSYDSHVDGVLTTVEFHKWRHTKIYAGGGGGVAIVKIATICVYGHKIERQKL